MTEASTIKHPAKFSDAILDVARTWLGPFALANLDGLGHTRVLDPFAGSGRIHDLVDPEANLSTWGVEIEPEWAAMHMWTTVGDALDLEFSDGFFDAEFTSPVYGNRMSDHHEAKDGSRRITYRHYLGRALHENNSGQLQWGPKYKDFHERAWAEGVRVLRSGGLFILNSKDHVRKGFIQHVTDWHVTCLTDLGLELVDRVRVDAPGMRFGDNGAVRVEHEDMVLLVKP